MGGPDGTAPRGSVLGVVWAGEPDIDPFMEETPPESLLDELGVRSMDYFLRVRGFSMKDAGIEEGDLVQIRLVRPGISPPDGAIVLAEVGLHEAIGGRTARITIKRFFRQDEKVILQPANSTMNPQEYKLDNVLILGIVVKILRQLFPA